MQPRWWRHLASATTPPDIYALVELSLSGPPFLHIDRCFFMANKFSSVVMCIKAFNYQLNLVSMLWRVHGGTLTPFRRSSTSAPKATCGHGFWCLRAATGTGFSRLAALRLLGWLPRPSVRP